MGDDTRAQGVFYPWTKKVVLTVQTVGTAPVSCWPGRRQQVAPASTFVQLVPKIVRLGQVKLHVRVV